MAELVKLKAPEGTCSVGGGGLKEPVKVDKDGYVKVPEGMVPSLLPLGFKVA